MEHARYAILADIHANLEALQAVLVDAQSARCTHYVCLGDIVGYNANPKECLQLIREMEMPCVKGNHDDYASSTDSLECLSSRASVAMQWTRQQLGESEKRWLTELKHVRHVANFSIVHATLDEPHRWGYVLDRYAAAASFNYQNTHVCFYGHTHIPRVYVRDTTVHTESYTRLKAEPGRQYLINVGSVGEPRDGIPLAAYVTFDVTTGVIELRRVPYDMATTEAKVLAAGLPARRKV